jgi:hypothetical protein
MDERGFIIGHIGRSKRIFNRATWEKKGKKEVLQGGSCECIIVLICVGTGGVALPLRR